MNSLFKNSVLNLERSRSEFQIGEQQKLQELLDIGQLAPADRKIEEILLQIPASGLSLLNMTEFIILNNPEFTSETNFWFNYTLKTYEKLDPSNIERPLIILAHLLSSLNQPEQAE